MPSQPPQDRQQSLNQGSDSGDDGFDDDQGVDPKGKKRGPNTQAARRDQNRIAQREFRLRKQQRIRDLELRVELLSSNKDDAFLSLDGMMQDLVRENSTLRQLVRDLSTFIGEGIGGFLPKLGWDIGSFEEFRNRSETDTMNDSYQHRKKNPHTPAPGIVPVLAGQKRRVEDPVSARERDNPNPMNGGPRKRSKPNPENEPSTSGQSTYTTQGNSTGGYNSNPNVSSSSYSRDYAPSTSSTTLPPLANIPPPPPPAPAGTRPTGSGPAEYASSNTRAGPPVLNTNLSSGGLYASGSGSGGGQSSGSHPFPHRSVGGAPVGTLSDTSTPSLVHSVSHTDEAQHAKREEVGKLVHYHMTNYKRNSSYTLPFSLRPTHVQRTVTHEFIIDGIIFPDVRDKMILYKGSFDLADAVHTLYSTAVIHTDDILTHSNWEISEEWFVKFGYLATRTVLDSTNKWRRERGEAEIPLSVIEDENTRFDQQAN